MATSYNLRPLIDGLVYYLDAANPRCYSGTGLTAVSLVNSISSSLVSGVGFSSSNGGFFTFDGVDDYINIPNNNLLTSTSALTINMWFNSDFTSARYTDLIGKGTSDTDEEYTLILASNSIYFDVGQNAGPYIQPSYTTPANTWLNLCATHLRSGGSSSLKLYLNGNQITASVISPTTAPNDNNSNTTIGRRFNAGSSSGASSFQGKISQVQIFNRELSISEVRQNYASVKGRYGL
jgi:hypothetical protein